MEGREEASDGAKGAEAITKPPGPDTRNLSPRQISSQQFTLFPKLPLEIRRMVWKEICFQPRNVDIWAKEPRDKHLAQMMLLGKAFDGRRTCTIEFRSHLRPPFVLHTSREARRTGLEHYTLEFGLELVHSLGSVQATLSTPSRIYVNWKCDTICPMILGSYTHLTRREMVSEFSGRIINQAHDSLKIAVDCKKLVLFGMKALRSIDFREIILYYVPNLLNNWALIPSSFDTAAPFAIEFTPIDDYSSKGDYSVALENLSRAKDAINDEIKLYPRYGGKGKEIPVVKLMVATVEAMLLPGRA